MKPMALWAGPECTVNRVGDTLHDQLDANGFAERLDDLDRLASLGITHLRLPLLWERTERAPGERDWAWADARLNRLRELGVQAIAGLVHHGSGPRWTQLLDPAFPALLADYARAVAERHPDITHWTPVNEPLTTARFSGLYGAWHPHARDDRSFVRALLHQVQAVVAAMRAIRTVQPAARLVQTEDLGHTTATAGLADQARFENARRWLSLDLLAGRVDRHHPLWRYLTRHGATDAELQTLVDAPCLPDVVGVNHYVTSERFLDERIHLYPRDCVGGNGRQRYADIEAVRALGGGIGGFAARLREAALRYGQPVAITEVHLGCTREEQLRWLQQAWREAEAVRDEGHAVEAVTCWASFGTFDWNSLVTRREGHYEPGLWDVRCDPPRPTALATLARQLARGEAPDHPVLEGPGWWQRADRISVRPVGLLSSRPVAGRPLLVTGARGTLARAFARVCAWRGLPCEVLGRDQMDIGDPASVAAQIGRLQPWAVVNAAGFVRVDDAEHDPRQWRDNVLGPAVLAEACARAGVPLMTFSSDLVFDGAQGSPYLEAHAPAPLNAYGRAKLEAERRVLALSPQALVIRTAAFFGPWDRHNFLTRGLSALREGQPWRAADDQWVSPTYVPDLVASALDLLVDGEHGLWHLANDGALTWAALARQAAEVAGLDVGGVQGCPGASLGQCAPRPAYSALGSQRGRLMPTLDHALTRYLAECLLWQDDAAEAEAVCA